MPATNDPSPPGSLPPAADSAVTPPAVPADAAASPAGAGSTEEAPSIPLPPPPTPPEQTSPKQLAAEIARLDGAHVVVVLALAFLLASFAVRNSDFWMHLATGRLLAHGQYRFGVDPFSYTSTDYWANHAWLYDLLQYALVSAAGGPESEAAGMLLVVLKALLVTLLAWILVQIRRPGRSLWIPAVCSALALLAMPARALLLQPTILSLLFLSLTLYVLQRPQQRQQGPQQQPRSPLTIYWTLLPLFIVWVNVDSWFLLGPITVALFLLGQLLQRLLSPIRTGADASQPGEVRLLGLVLLAGLAVCLVNPHHYHAFTLPAQLPLAPAAGVLEKEDLFRPNFYWLFQDDYRESALAQSVAGYAFWLLLVLGLASFAGSVFSGWRWWRLTIWLAFLLLSVYHVRAIGLFAVVAAPITALNWQDIIASRFGTVPRVDRLWKAWSLAGRLLTLLVGVALLAAAWSGGLFLSWVNGFPTSLPAGRRVAWAVDVEPSLRKAALQLCAWREQGLLRPEDHGFNYSPDVANYCAWYCPEEKGFLDYRFDLVSRELGKAFVDVRQALRRDPLPVGESVPPRTDWQKVFRDRGINHVVLYGTDSSPVAQGMYNSLRAAFWMLLDPEHWTLVYMDGRSSIFRWNDAPSKDGPRRRVIPPFDLNARAFGREAEQAPAESSEQVPPQRDLVARWLQRQPAVPLDADLALRYQEYFNQIRQYWPYRAVAATAIADWSGTVGLAAGNPGSVAAPANLALDFWPNFLAFYSPLYMNVFLRDKSYGPPAAPLLAVRAARRAIADNPEHALSYFLLAEAYTTLWEEQEEHWVGRSSSIQELRPRQKLRQIQLITALQDYLLLRPQDGDAHLKLFQNFLRLQYLDLALDHLRQAAESIASAGPGRRESREDFKRRLEPMQQELANLKSEVKKREEAYRVEAKNKPLGDKVEIALRNRLVREALDLLLQADAAQRGPVEIDRLFDLLLSTGQSEQARAILSEDLRPLLGPHFDWYNVLIGAACGNYQRAGESLEETLRQSRRATLEGALRLLEAQTFQGSLTPGSLYSTSSMPSGVHELANVRVLRGMLALEQGDNAVAAKYFREALNMGESEQFHFESRPIAVRYLQLIKDAGGAP